MRGALQSAEIKLPELREAALHMAIYAGWTVGAAFDEAVTLAAKALDLPAPRSRRSARRRGIPQSGWSRGPSPSRR